MANFVLSLVMLVAFALIAGAFVYWRRTGQAKQPVLMVVLALVAIANVVIWTLPAPDGQSLIEQAEGGGAVKGD